MGECVIGIHWMGTKMEQMRFCDVSALEDAIRAHNKALQQIDKVVGRERFRPRMEECVRPRKRKSAAERKPWDCIVMLKMILLCELFALPDERAELEVRDRVSFRLFLGLPLNAKTSDEDTLRTHREKLARMGGVKALLDEFQAQLAAAGCLAKGGRIVGASIVAGPVATQHARGKRTDQGR